MQELLRQAGEKVLWTARRKGVEAEAYLLYNRELSVDVKRGKVETLKEAEEIGLGVRVFNQGRLGFVYSSDLSAQAVAQSVQDAIDISQNTPLDLYNQLPEPVNSYPTLDIYDPQICVTPLENKIELAREAERVARAFDPRIAVVERAGYEEADFNTLIMNSKGLLASAQGNYSTLFISLVAQDEEDSQTGFAVMSKKKFAELDPAALGQEAAHRALRSLGATTSATANLPCIMEPFVTARFLSLLAPSLQGDAVLKGKSMLKDRLGDKIAATAVTLVDDGVLPGGIAAFPFDGEGMPCQRTGLIQDGCLKAFLYDNYSAMKADQVSTGNGQRSSFRSLPSVGITNLVLSPGLKDPADLRIDIKTGILITEVMGMHTANPISGDFSLGASGIMIREGELAEPVRGITIAGNIFTWLKNVQAVGSDLRFYGARAAPSIRMEGISVGGQ